MAASKKALKMAIKELKASRTKHFKSLMSFKHHGFVTLKESAVIEARITECYNNLIKPIETALESMKTRRSANG